MRRPLNATEKRHVGKEAKELELVEAGLVEELEELLTVYERDDWEAVRRMLATIPFEHIMSKTGYGRRQIYYLRAGKRCPSNRRLRSLYLCTDAFAASAAGTTTRP